MSNTLLSISRHLYRTAWPLLFTLFLTANLGATTTPPLLGHWTFEPGYEKQDLQGNFPNLELRGAIVADGFLDVGVEAYAYSKGYSGPTIIEKTLVVWVKLDDIELRGGSILTIDKLDLNVYDGIVYGESKPYQWMAGSELLSRYFGGYGQPEETEAGKLVQIAISYESVLGLKKIKLYRDGELISSSIVLDFPSFGGSATEILFGLRHTLALGGLPLQPWVDAKIEEARIYGGVLAGIDLKSLVCFKVKDTDPPVADSYTLEAECALVGANLLVQAAGLTVDAKVVLFSGTRATSAPPADLPENRIRFTLADAKAGVYHLFAHAYAANNSYDSYWVRVNGGAWTSWNSWGTYGKYAWFQVNAGVELSAGTNIIDFAYREENALLDKIVLNLSGVLPTGLGGTDPTCGQAPANQSPVAVAKASPLTGTAPLTVYLDGSASSDPDGTIASYRWTYTGGGSATGAKPTVTLTDPGTYTFTLTVTDNDGATATDHVSVEVKAAVVDPPTSNDDYTLEAECALVGASFQLKADNDAANGKAVLYTGDRSISAPPADLPANRIRFTVADAKAGTYFLFARAYAGDKSSDSYWVRVNGGAWTSWNAWGTYGMYAWFQVNAGVELSTGTNVIDFAYREEHGRLDKINLSLSGVLPTGLGGIDLTCGQAPANQSPVAVAKASPLTGTAPLTVKLDGSASTDPDGTIASYRWTYTGGDSATGAQPSVTLTDPGTYTFTLTVTDNDGATATDHVSVEVKAAVVDPPTSNDDYTLEAECALVGASFQLKADNDAANGKAVLYTGDRSISTPPADLPANRIRFTVADAKAGTYFLFARAYAGDKSSDSYWVRVNGGTWTSWNAWGTYGQYAWFEVTGSPVTLKQGTNVIDFAYREEHGRLDKINLRASSTKPTGLGATDPTCDQAPANQSPVAVAKASVSVGTAPLTVTLDGSASSDPDGTIASFLWTYTGGGTVTGAKPTVTLTTPGTYTFTLTVTDNDGATATDQVSVEVKAEVVDPPTDNDDDYTLEAECALVGAKFLVQTDGLSVDGKVVLFSGTRATSAPPADLPENRIRFTLADAKAGIYHLFARARADNNSYDSYWVRVNGGAWKSWNSWGTYGKYAWFEVSAGVELTAGTNVIDFAYREENALLDKITLNLSGVLPTGLGGIDLSCDQTPPQQECAPLITRVDLSTQFVLLNAQVRLDVLFSDKYDRDDHLVEVSWGDGSKSILTIDQLKNQAFGLHAYLSIGLFDITVRLLDGCGGVVIDLYDYQVMCTERPEEWVDGKGSYASPKGALLNNLLLFGDAKYDFLGKYETDGSLSGHFNLDLTWSNKSFRSTSVDYLHISGDFGKMKGKGKMNGAGNYTYLITFEDNLSLLGLLSFDKMRVQLWDEDRNHALVYDSYIGASIFGFLCTDISLGYVTIHSPSVFLGGLLGSAVKETEVSPLDEATVAVYPNPATDRVNLSIRGFAQEAEVRMMDQTGRVVLTQRLAADQEQVELDFAHRNLAAGVYLITVSSADRTVTQRLSIVN